MAKYQKVDNCGSVPYPDRSGRFLTAGEVVEGDEWESLLLLGFVKRIEAAVAAPVKASEPVASVKASEPAVSVEASEPAVVVQSQPVDEDPDRMSAHTQEASDGVQVNDGSGAEAVDSPKTGKSGNKGMPGRPPTGRRS